MSLPGLKHHQITFKYKRVANVCPGIEGALPDEEFRSKQIKKTKTYRGIVKHDILFRCIAM